VNRAEPTLLFRVSIGDVGDIHGGDSAVVQERVPLGRCAVGHRGPVLASGLPEEVVYTPAAAVDPCAETGVRGQGVKTGVLFQRADISNPLGRRRADSCVIGPDPEAAPMGRELLDVDHRQVVSGQRVLGREQREVREMLVVDRVELDLRHEVEQVGEFDAQGACRLEGHREPGHEVVEVGHVGQNVVGDDEIRTPAAPHQIRGGFSTEEAGLRGHSARHGGGGDVGGRLDAQHRDAGGDEVLQQIAVVARHLQDQALGSQVEVGDGGKGESPTVFEPAIRMGGEVGVVLEQRTGRHHRLELDQQAAVAHQGVERVAGLVAVGVLRQKVGASGVDPRSTNVVVSGAPHNRHGGAALTGPPPRECLPPREGLRSGLPGRTPGTSAPEGLWSGLPGRS